MPAGEWPRCGVLAYLLTRSNRVAVVVEGGLVQAVVVEPAAIPLDAVFAGRD